MNPHLSHLLKRCPDLSSCRKEVEQAFEAMRACYSSKGKLLLAGNGGSAADADHWAGELMKGFCSRRPLSAEEKSALPPEVATQLQGALPAIPLGSFPALGSAFANDVAPELVFAQLVWGLGLPGDVFVGISTSGNAKNVCAAAQTARARKLTVIGLTGEDGGQLKNHCDIAIRVPARETYLVQEYHLPIYHCLSLMLEDEFFK